MAWAAACRHWVVWSVGRTSQAALALPYEPLSWAGPLGHSNQMNSAAATAPRCHQLAGSRPDQRVSCHWATAKPYVTAIGSSSTSTAAPTNSWPVSAPPTSSASIAPVTTTHPVTAPSNGRARKGVGASANSPREVTRLISPLSLRHDLRRQVRGSPFVTGEDVQEEQEHVQHVEEDRRGQQR